MRNISDKINLKKNILSYKDRVYEQEIEQLSGLQELYFSS